MSEEGNEASEDLPPADSSPTRARDPSKGGRPTKLTPEVHATIIALIRNGAFRVQACAEAGISTKTLRNWEKQALDDVEPYASFIEELEIAQHRSEAKLQVIHYGLATGATQPLLKMGVDPEAVSLHALQFQLERGGTRPFADLKKMELTGKDGEPLRGSEVTPEAAAAMVREAFGEQARRELEAREAEGAEPSSEP